MYTCVGFGVRLRKARLARGYTQAQLCMKITGSGRHNISYISDFEHGRHLPSAPTTCALANVLGVSVDYFFTT